MELLWHDFCVRFGRDPCFNCSDSTATWREHHLPDMDFRPISFWANWILIGALIVGVVATYGIVVSANVKESAANSKIAELNKETTKLSADAEASRAAIADANARAVEAQLALEKFKSPRSMTLEQQTRIEFVKGAAICAEISKFDLVT